MLHSEARALRVLAREKLDQRDKLIRKVRADNPDEWTYLRLARQVGCSLELIAHIVNKGDQDD